MRWGGRRDSNPRRPESQSGALPAELRPPSSKQTKNRRLHGPQYRPNPNSIPALPDLTRTQYGSADAPDGCHGPKTAACQPPIVYEGRGRNHQPCRDTFKMARPEGLLGALAPRPFGVALRAIKRPSAVCRTRLLSVGGSNRRVRQWPTRGFNRHIENGAPGGITRRSRASPLRGRPGGRSPSALRAAVVEPLVVGRGFELTRMAAGADGRHRDSWRKWRARRDSNPRPAD